jgi:hypothetical protein
MQEFMRALDVLLVIHDTKEFRRVNGLRLEAWLAWPIGCTVTADSKPERAWRGVRSGPGMRGAMYGLSLWFHARRGGGAGTIGYSVIRKCAIVSA